MAIIALVVLEMVSVLILCVGIAFEKQFPIVLGLVGYVPALAKIAQRVISSPCWM